MGSMNDHMTLEEFLKLPEVKPPYEYVEGRVTQKVPPRARRSVLLGGFLTRLHFAAEMRLGMSLQSLRCTFAGRSYTFDLAYFDWSRIQFEDNGEPEDDVFDPPDWIVEILSRGQSLNAMFHRHNWCIEQGVRLAWLVDPGSEQVYVFRPSESVYLFSGDDILDASGILHDFRVQVCEVFEWLRPGKVD